MDLPVIAVLTKIVEYNLLVQRQVGEPNPTGWCVMCTHQAMDFIASRKNIIIVFVGVSSDAVTGHFRVY